MNNRLENTGKNKDITNYDQWSSLETNPDKEILDSKTAQRILPYLTLDSLSAHETANILSFANRSVNAMQLEEYRLDPFNGIMKAESAVAKLAGEASSWDNRDVPQKLQQARKLFAAALFDANRGSAPKVKQRIYETFFGMSPNVTSCCGGLRGSLELLTIAERNTRDPGAESLYGETVLNYSFSERNDFKTILNESTPIQQMRLLPIYNNLALRCDPDGWSKGTLDKILQALEDVKEKPDTKPLIKIVAEGIDDNIRGYLWTKWDIVDPNDPKYADIIAENQKRQELAWQKQQKLHAAFPALSRNQHLTIIAPGVAATSIRNGIGTISDQNGHTASMLDYSEQNYFELDMNSSFLLSAAHNPWVKDIINKKLAIKLEEVPLDAQIQLLKFMTEANNDRFDALSSAMNSISEPIRLKLAENFLAADFGEDFGDSLLEIAKSERLSDVEKEKIFDSISSCRTSIDGITDLFSGKDNGDFTKQFSRAANERLTDAITVFSYIAQTGKAEADLDWAGYAEFDYNSAMEALEYERKSLEIINDTVRDVAKGIRGSFIETMLSADLKYGNSRGNRAVYNLYSPNYGYVLLHTRAVGAQVFDNRTEHGKDRSRYDMFNSNTGTEASISFTVNPEDPKIIINPFVPIDLDKEYSPYVSAIRLDREGRNPDWAPNDKRRSPINTIGTCSVDLSSIGHKGDLPNPSNKIAKLLSVGNKIRSKTHDNSFSLNHNTKWFDQNKYGTDAGFEEIVKWFDIRMQALCNRDKEKLSKNQNSYAYKKKEKLMGKMGHEAVKLVEGKTWQTNS